MDTAHAEFTPRQSAVLAEALRLLVEGGDKALTTAGLWAAMTSALAGVGAAFVRSREIS